MTEQTKQKQDDIQVIDVTGEVEPRKDLKFYKVFRVTYTAEDGSTRDGTFCVKRLTLGEIGQVGVRKAVLNGDRIVDARTDLLHDIAAHLEFALVEKPSWFTGLGGYEEGVLFRVHAEVMKFEESFRRPVAK